MNMEYVKKILEESEYPTLEYRSIKKDYNSSKNVNDAICAECGGVCCKTCGCNFSPDDFEDTSFEGLKREIEKGYISIDLVFSEQIFFDVDVYILRVRNQGSPIVDINSFSRTPCILLGEKGCKFDYDTRPTGGKLLKPKTISSFCHEMACNDSQYDLRDCCWEWLPHKKVLYQLAEYFENKDIPCSI